MTFRLEDVSKIAWAMHGESLESFVRGLASHPKDALVAAMRERPGVSETGVKCSVSGKVATVGISGPLMRSVPAWFSWLGIEATETGKVAEAVERFAADPSIETIVLRVDSPGGDAQGIGEAADAIHKAGKKKNVYAVVEGMAASAAYWLASQAGHIAAAPDSIVGSIGIYQVLVDTSAAAEREGIKVRVIKSGEHKGAGVSGSPITDAQIAARQEVVDGLAALFVGAVARGRKHVISKGDVTALATGQAWLAAPAMKHGLVDSTEPSSKSLTRINEETKAMSEKNAEELAKAQAGAVTSERARAAEIRKAFPNHLAFALEQIELGASLPEARAAFATVLEKELAEKDKALAAAKAETDKVRAEAAKPAPEKRTVPGAADPVRRGGDPAQAEASEDGAGFDFMAEARKHAKERGVSMTAAMKYVADHNPDAHRGWVESQPKVKRGKEPFARHDLAGKPIKTTK